MNLFTRLTATLAVASLAGCATCREHPLACELGVVFAAGLVAAASTGDSGHGPIDAQGAKRPSCSAGPC